MNSLMFEEDKKFKGTTAYSVVSKPYSIEPTAKQVDTLLQTPSTWRDDYFKEELKVFCENTLALYKKYFRGNNIESLRPRFHRLLIETGEEEATLSMLPNFVAYLDVLISVYYFNPVRLKNVHNKDQVRTFNHRHAVYCWNLFLHFEGLLYHEEEDVSDEESKLSHINPERTVLREMIPEHKEYIELLLPTVVKLLQFSLFVREHDFVIE